MGLSRRIGQSAVSVDAAALPSGEFYDVRFHAAHALIWVDQLIALPTAKATYFGDVRLILHMTDPETQLALCQEVIGKCDTLGITVSIGFSLAANGAQVSAVNSATDVTYSGATVTFATCWLAELQWLRNAVWLEYINEHLVPLCGGTFIALDIEGYLFNIGQPTELALTDAGTTSGGLATLMARFRRAVTASRKVPYIYPAMPTDQCLAHIVAASGASDRSAVVADERCYRADDRQRIDQEDYEAFIGANAAGKNQVLDENPGAVWVPALYGSPLRKWGTRIRTDYYNLAPRKGLIFMNETDDIASIGTAEWFTGELIEPLNAYVTHCWYVAPSIAGAQVYDERDLGSNYGGAGARDLLPWRFDTGITAIRAIFDKHYDGWHCIGPDPADGWFSDACLPISGDLGIVADVYLSTAACAAVPGGDYRIILASSKENNSWWAICYVKDTDTIELRIRIAGPSHEVMTMIVAPSKDVKIRLFISYKASTKEWLHQTNRTITTATALYTDHLDLGMGTDVIDRTTFKGFDGLIFPAEGYIMILNKYISDADKTAMLTDSYPLGF